MTSNHLLRTTVVAPEKDREDENVEIPVGRFVGQGPCYIEKSNFLNCFCSPSLEKSILLECYSVGKASSESWGLWLCPLSVLIPSGQGAHGTRAEQRWKARARESEGAAVTWASFLSGIFVR